MKKIILLFFSLVCAMSAWVKTIQKRMQVFLLILTVWLLPSVAGAEECLDGFHTLNLEEPLAATCTTAGHRGGYTCSACNKHFSDAEGKAEIDKWETDALGHDFSENGFCKHGDAYEPAIEVTAENADSLGLDVNYYYGGYYAIGNAGQLYWFASFVNDNGMTYASAVLTANIVVNDTASWKSWNDETEDLRTWMPINGYEGVFDGNSHTIAGLYHSSNDDAVGLFGLLNVGLIENTGVIASYIKGNKKVGGVCGEIPSGGIITNCYNTGTLNGWEKVGGVCGYNSRGIITNCYNTGTLNCSHIAGGVCGENIEGIISNCYNTGTLNGWENVGGVYGSDFRGAIANCYYLAAENNDDGAREATQFASGEVAYLLNESRSEGTDYDPLSWYQQLGANGDITPVLVKSDTTIVYAGYADCMATEISYSNKRLATTQGQHDFTDHTILSTEANENGLYDILCGHGCGAKISEEGNDEEKNIMVLQGFQGDKNLELTYNAKDGKYHYDGDLTISDATDFNSPVEFVADKVVYSRLANKDTMSIILPFDVPADRLNGVAYKFTSFNGKDLFFESTDGIQANTPCMLSGIKTLGEPVITAELENVTIKASNPIDVEDATGKSAHFGVYEKSLFECGGHDYYGFKNNQFVKAGIDIEVSPFRAAVRLKKSALRSLSYNPATLGIVFDGNEVTHAADIEQTMTGKVNVHDVTGRILRHNVEAANCTEGLEPGVYVVNGEKVVVTVKE